MENKKLTLWKQRYEAAANDYRSEQERMVRRADLYNGDHTIYKPDGTKAAQDATHVRNVCFEMVETQVDSSIPAPKVTAIRQEDEELAKIIEDMVRSVLDRLPVERINDNAERVCPIQGGHGLLVDWNAGVSGRGWMGALCVGMLHPRRIVPQSGIYEVADMDYIFTVTPQTRRQIEVQFGVKLQDENEEDAQARALDAAQDTTGEIVSLITAYYREKSGSFGRYRWVNDTQVEDISDYQSRRVKKCRKCGAVGDGLKCDYCGSTAFDEELMEYEELTEDIETARGMHIPAMSPAYDEYGQVMLEETAQEDGLMAQMRPAGMTAGPVLRQRRVVLAPTRIPYYKPDMFPVLLRKNVSRDGSFLGGSDMDVIADQQNAMNKISTKLVGKVLGGGSFATVPSGYKAAVDDRDNMVYEIENAADINKFHVFNTQVDVGNDLALRQQIYEEARQTIGVTDSMQGRKDATATSAVAKQFSARQAEGRLESKRTMKRALFADLFEAIFKWMLAYADEPRPIRSYNSTGEMEYRVFDRHDFLYQTPAGEWKYNTDFLFSCDDTAPLASDRTAMWQECRLNFQQGAMGDTQQIDTLLRFWKQMDRLHYPLAGEMLSSLKTAKEQQEAMQQQAAQVPQQEPAPGGAEAVAAAMGGGAAL